MRYTHDIAANSVSRIYTRKKEATLPPSTRRQQTLSIYLAKATIRDSSDLIKNSETPTMLPALADGNALGTLYVRESVQHPPGWHAFLSQTADLSSCFITTSASGAALLVQAEGRWLGVAFGLGRHILDLTQFEEDFGLIVALNSVDPLSIRSIDRERLDALAHHSREQATREIALENFGIDIERDILRAVVGKPLDPALGSRLAGRESLVATAFVQPNTLLDLLGRYVKAYNRTDYRTRFPWVGRIKHMRDPQRIQSLNTTLIDKLRAQEFDHLWMALPEIINWDDIDGFQFGTSRAAVPTSDIHVKEYLDWRGVDQVSLEKLRTDRVSSRSATTSVIQYSWSVYRCIYCELTDHDGTYILSNGKWHLVASDFASEVTSDIQSIPATQLHLPPYTKGQHENAYNQLMATANGPDAFCADRVPITYGGGHSLVEFCDVYRKSHILAHVKRYSESSVLSHLFAQGVVSALPFMTDPLFRAALNEKLPATHRLADPNPNPSRTDIEIAYIVLSRTQRARLDLPFFSKVTLRQAYRQLTGYDVRVTFSRPPLAPAP